MLRIVGAGALGVVAISISPFCLGQTMSSSNQTVSSSNQTVSSSKRDSRLEAAEADVSLLKRLVKEQDRRIAELEKTVKSLQASSSAAKEKPTAHELDKSIFKPAARWQNPLAWTQIRKGISRAQVEEILGTPTSVESVVDYQTLFYKGDVAGSGAVAGVIKLTDDRVSEISPPAF